MPTSSESQDPRAACLAAYLRQRADAFSLSADVNDSPLTARAGMALLDAAGMAEAMMRDDPRLLVLSEAGVFEPMPMGAARFVETAEIRALIQRPIVARAENGRVILAMLVEGVSRS